MKRCVLPIGFCFFWLFLFCWQSPLCPQEKPGKDKPNSIEGDWTAVIRDRGSGGIRDLMPDLRSSSFKGKVPTIFRWRITKESIEVGKHAEAFCPQKRYTYKLNPGGQANAIDMSLVEIDLDIAEKADRRQLDAKAKEAQQGIYYVNDGYLLICIGRNTRPKKITTDETDNPATIDILRRGRLYKEDETGSSNPKTKDSSNPKSKGK